MAKREGATRNGSTVTVGDFIFEGYKPKIVFISWKQDKKKYEKKVLDLMAKHYEFYGKFQQESQYVKKGSILFCDKGTHLTKFDMLKDHAVVDSGNTPIGICRDCKSNDNIYTFGSCSSTLRDSDHKRTPVTAWNGARHMVGEKCIPMLDGSWKKTTPDNNLKIWDYEAKDYCDVITTEAYLLCYYGGLIKVVEVYNQTKGLVKIADKYYATVDAKIRATPNGQQIGGNRIFKKGAIIKVVNPSKEPEKVDGSDESWIKIYYDGNSVGYVALGLLDELPKPITGHTFNYKWEKSQYVTQDFKDKTVGVAKSLGIVPDDLMAVMAFESYGCNPAQGNMAGGSAVGLVQFMPDVAKELNTTSAKLITMSGVEQLDYVFGYFYPYKGRCQSLGDVYMRVLWPNGVGKNDSYVLYSKGSKYYSANAGLDVNKDGNITKKEAVQVVIDKRQEYT